MIRALLLFILISLSPMRGFFDHLVEKNYVIANFQPMVNFLTSDSILWITPDSCTSLDPFINIDMGQKEFGNLVDEKICNCEFRRALIKTVLMTSLVWLILFMSIFLEFNPRSFYDLNLVGVKVSVAQRN